LNSTVSRSASSTTRSPFTSAGVIVRAAELEQHAQQVGVVHAAVAVHIALHRLAVDADVVDLEGPLAPPELMPRLSRQ
jgi:hypothetical protein